MPTFDLLRYKLTLNFMFLLPLASFSSEYYTIVFFSQEILLTRK